MASSSDDVGEGSSISTRKAYENYGKETKIFSDAAGIRCGGQQPPRKAMPVILSYASGLRFVTHPAFTGSEMTLASGREPSEPGPVLCGYGKYVTDIDSKRER